MALKEASQENLRESGTQEVLQMTNELREAFSEFVYVVTHDLRAPIRQVAGFTGLLERRVAEGEQDLTEITGYILEGTRKVNSLLDDLIDYSRIEEERMVPTDFDAEECCEAALEAVGLTLDEHVTIHRQSLPRVHADRGYLIRAFCHLFRNAKTFSRRPLELRVEADVVDDLVLFSITDNGPGIPPESHDRVFDVFVTLKSASEGNGIGLPCVRRICRRQGGDAWIERSSERGTTVCFSLPRSSARSHRKTG